MRPAKKPRVLAQPTITGPKEVKVGGIVYGVPAGAGVRIVGGGQLAYVLYHAKIHCFVQSGELEIPTSIRAALASRYFGGAA
jgi:hypothetical protein